MDSLKSSGVYESSGVAENHPAIACERRQREPSAVGHGLGPVANHLAAFEHLLHKGMLLEGLQNMLWINAWVFVIEASDEAKRNNVIFAPVNPCPAVLMRGQRPAHGVNDFARSDTARRNFPQFLYPNAISLRVRILFEIEFLNELFGQRSTRPLGENHDFCI